MDSGPVSQNQGVVGLRVVCLRVVGGSGDTWLVFGSLHMFSFTLWSYARVHCRVAKLQRITVLEKGSDLAPKKSL